jgi:hypothetical protein
MIIYVDIDETICYYEDKKNRNYENAKPYLDRIKKINKLYDDGNTIVYWTARGTVTGLKWFQLTLKQLNEWNAKFHELKMGKPSYDLFIDDKNINSEKYFNSSKDDLDYKILFPSN